MKSIINRKLYDTETATQLAGWENMPDSSDFRHVRERLYRSPNGAYFLVGEGGPKSEYAVDRGDRTSSGERWRVLTAEEALAWAESVGATACILEHFSEMVEAG